MRYTEIKYVKQEDDCGTESHLNGSSSNIREKRERDYYRSGDAGIEHLEGGNILNMSVEKKWHRWIAIAIALLMLVTLAMPMNVSKVSAATTNLQNPRTASDGTVTWDCVWFGHYPQSAYEPKQEPENPNEKDIYTDSDGTKFVYIEYPKNDLNYYYKVDQIKWRVLSVEGNEALLLADKNLDRGIPYNETWEDVTWKTCTMRSWLNGYGSGSNQNGIDYTSDNFIDRAFTSNEKNAILQKTVENADNPYFGTEGGNDTSDKLFLPSIGEMTTPAYGLPSDYNGSDSREAEGTAYTANEGNCYWYCLRSPGGNSCDAALVDAIGYVSTIGYYVNDTTYGVRPALRLNLTSNLWSYAGTVSSDGTVDEDAAPGGGNIPVDPDPDTPDASEPIAKDVSINYAPSNRAKNRSTKLYYEDQYFTSDNSAYNHDLSKVSLGLAMSAFSAKKAKDGTELKRYENVENLLTEKLGFHHYKQYNYNIILDDTSDKVAFSLARKTVKFNESTVPILVVALRGGGYGGEWESNGRVTGGTDPQLHKGFSSAAGKVYQEVKNYIENSKLDSKNLKVWVTGFSRGAAVSNILSYQMVSKGLIEGKNLYSYTFATPRTTKKKVKQPGIYNIINPIDLVPEVPFAEWGYGRYGTDIFLPYKTNSKTYSSQLKKMRSEFETETGDSYNPYPSHRVFVTNLLSLVRSMAGKTEAGYGKNYQDKMAKALGIYLGSSDEVVDLYGLFNTIGINFYNPVVIVKLGRTFYLAGPNGVILDIVKSKENAELLKQHWSETYLAWLKTNTPTHGKNKLLKVKCPVDIDIYDTTDNTLIARIENNEYSDFIQENPDTALEVFVDDNGEKNIWLPDDGRYRVEVKATDCGNMHYSISEYDEEGQLVVKSNFADIMLQKGDVFEGNISNEAGAENGAYNLTKNEREEISPTEILTSEDNTLTEIKIITEVDGNGTVLGGEVYTQGDSVVLAANEGEQADFIGWYENGTSISKEPVLHFIAQKDKTITAKFAERLNGSQIILGKTDYVFTGKPCNPEVVIKVGDKILKEGSDYRLEYRNNVNAGTGLVVIEGLGKYTGSVETTFTIRKAFQSVDAKSCTKTYGNKAFSLGAKAKTKLTYKSSNTKVATVNSTGKVTLKGPGKTTITITAAATTNYNAASKSITITVKPKKATLKKAKSTKKRTLKVMWKRDTKATGYQVVIAQNKKFKKGQKTALIKKNKTTSRTFKKLKSRKNYYYKVRAYKQVGKTKIYGAYSKAKRIKVK